MKKDVHLLFIYDMIIFYNYNICYIYINCISLKNYEKHEYKRSTIDRKNLAAKIICSDIRYMNQR